MCYFIQALEPLTRDSIVSWAVDTLRGEGYDCVAVRGVSGLAIGPIVANELGIHLVVVRKPGDGSHSCAKSEGYLGKKVAIIDDFISSGDTMRAIMEVAKNPASILLYNDVVKTGYWSSQDNFHGTPILRWSGRINRYA